MSSRSAPGSASGARSPAGSEMRYCSDVEGPESCCQSCHEDDDMYDYPMITDRRDGEDYYVCCAQSRNLESHATQG